MGMAAKLVIWPEPFKRSFEPLTPGGSIWNLVQNGPVAFKENFETVEIWETWVKGWPHVLTNLYVLI